MHLSVRKLLISTILLVVFFLVVTFLVYTGSTVNIDTRILEITLDLRNPILDPIMRFVSSFGDGVSALLTFSVFAIALFVRGFKREFKISFLIWVGPLLSWGLKSIIARPRPEDFVLEGYNLTSDFSFPSGHVVFYVVFFGLVALYARYLPDLTTIGRRILLATSIILSSSIGISRIYLGVHWPTDVIGGYLLGFAILSVIIIAYLKLNGAQRG